MCYEPTGAWTCCELRSVVAAIVIWKAAGDHAPPFFLLHSRSLNNSLGGWLQKLKFVVWLLSNNHLKRNPNRAIPNYSGRSWISPLKCKQSCLLHWRNKLVMTGLKQPVAVSHEGTRANPAGLLSCQSQLFPSLARSPSGHEPVRLLRAGIACRRVRE